VLQSRSQTCAPGGTSVRGCVGIQTVLASIFQTRRRPSFQAGTAGGLEVRSRRSHPLASLASRRLALDGLNYEYNINAMRYRPGSKEKTRRRILDAASRRFKEKGYAGAGLQELMRSADLTVGGFYAHFESKEALLAETLEHALNENTDLLFSGLEELSGEPWLREVLRRYLSRRHRDDVAEGCPAPAVAADVVRQGPEVRAAFERALRRCLLQMQERLPAQSALAPEDRALATMSLMIGGILLSRAVEDRPLSDRILLACRRFAAPPEDPTP
jgi:TetR/AcrR family transcriptional regulator, transcriptional repressor for nem operon